MSAVIQNEFTGNNSTTQYSFTFPYLKTSDIKASLDGVATTAFTLPNATTLQFNTAPGSGVKIKIFRETSVDDLTATFYAGSAIKSEDLNDNFTQNLYKTQEVGTRSLNTLGGTMTGNLVLDTQADLVFEGATADAHETTIKVVDPTADRTITFPNVTGTVVTTGDTGTVATAMIAGDAVNGTKIADDSINSEHYVDASIDTQHIADAQITTAKIADSNVTTDKIADNAINGNKIATNSVGQGELSANAVTTVKIAADAVNGTKIADNSIDSEHYVDGSIDNAHLANNSVTLAKMADDSVGSAELVDSSVVTAALADNSVTLAKMVDNSVGTSELVNSSVTTDKINNLAVTNAKIADRTIQGSKIDQRTISGGEIQQNTITSTELANNSVTGNEIATNSVGEGELSSNAVTTVKIADNAVSTAKIADSELKTLAGMQSGTASKLADSTALTADIADLNQIDGLTKQTTITDSDASFPTSGAVVDYVAAQIAPLGGLEVIATEVAFPNTQPQSGVVISISDAGGVVFNGSGTSTTGRTVGGSTVTINNAPSSLNSETLAAGVGLMVSSTGSGQVYNYHKILGKEEDIKQLSDDINDFAERYRVGSTNPTSALDAGDLFFNTSTSKLLVYNATNTAWEEAQSIGNFFISTLSPAFNGSVQDFTITNAPTNAEQIILSINGVIQKPNAGTSTPSEGFALSGNTVKLAAAPATGSTYFAVVLGSTVNIGTPSNNTVTTAILQNGSVTDAKVNASAAIAGSKISPDFGSQNIVTTGSIGIGIGSQTPSTPQKQLHIAHDSSPRIMLSNDTTGHATPNGTELLLDSDGNFEILQRENLNLEFFTNGSQRMTIDNNGDVGIGTSSPVTLLNLNVDTEANLGNNSEGIRLTSGSSNAQFVRLGSSYSNGSVTGPGTLLYSSNKLSIRADNGNPITFHNGSSLAERLSINSNGTKEIKNGNLNINSTYIDFSGSISTPSTAAAIYRPADNTLAFSTANNERMRLDSSGNVGINTTAPVEKLGVSGNIRFVNPTNNTSRINALASGSYNVGNSGGSAVCFQRFSDAGGGSDEIFFETHHQGSFHGEALRIEKTGDIKVKRGDLYFETAGKGIVLGATSNTDANTLDDYEEGTFSATATAVGYSGGNAIAMADEKYTKIGRIVHFNMRLTVASSLSDGDLTISGLPFSTAQDSVVDFSWQDAAGFSGGQGKISGTSCVRFGGTFPTHHTGSANIIFSGTYITNS